MGTIPQSGWSGCPVLVTGGAGFIGSHLVEALLGLGARVRVIDNYATGSRANLRGRLGSVEVIEDDIRDAAACRAACAGVRFVFHEAALGSVPRSLADPATTIAVNVSGTANVFAAARENGVERVIYASSSSVYGDSEALPKTEGREGRPLSPYALSKQMNEQLADTFARSYAMALVGLRYFNVFGPRQDPDGPYAAVIPRFFMACLTDASPVIYGDGRQSRDFTYVADAVAANLLAARSPLGPSARVYNVAGGHRTSVIELAAAIRSVVGRGAPPRHEPSRPGDVPHSLADLALVRKELGYEPQTGLQPGLELCHAGYAGRVGAGSRGEALSR